MLDTVSPVRYDLRGASWLAIWVACHGNVKSAFCSLTVAGLVRVHGPTRIRDAFKYPAFQACKTQSRNPCVEIPMEYDAS